MADKNCPQPLGDNAMTISLSTYRTPTTTTFDSLFDSLFDPFFASATTPIKKTFSTNGNNSFLLYRNVPDYCTVRDVPDYCSQVIFTHRPPTPLQPTPRCCV